jgi:hypothetical protein
MVLINSVYSFAPAFFIFCKKAPGLGPKGLKLTWKICFGFEAVSGNI